MSITRRVFLRNSALAVVGTAAVPSFPVESMNTAEPVPTVLPLIPPMKALVWVPFPILMAAWLAPRRGRDDPRLM